VQARGKRHKYDGYPGNCETVIVTDLFPGQDSFMNSIFTAETQSTQS
jgi:hypothetical protein